MKQDLAGEAIGVSGANGFVGRALVGEILARGGFPVRLLRRPCAAAVPGLNDRIVGEIHGETDWRPHLADCASVVHLAARVHVMAEAIADPLAAFRRVNRDGTAKLARDCAEIGVRRLVFVSSVKVNGEATAFDPRTGLGAPFTARDLPHPVDEYGLSKCEAEDAALEIARATGLEVSIVRPPLVYGPGVGGNMQRLLGLVARGVPLPFAAIDNRRSLVGVRNLADLLILAARHPAAAGRVFLAGDGADLSTPDLIRGLARALGKPARVFPVPLAVLRLVGRLSGKTAEIERLTQSLQMDTEDTARRLGWVPPVSQEAGFREMAEHFLRAQD